MWNIRKLVSKGDYMYAVVPEHPNATSLGYVFEHRVVVENHLKRLLTVDEIVHHKNGEKKDNRIENLEVMDRIEHVRMHALERGFLNCILKCPNCDTIFERSYRQAFQTAPKKFGVFCTRSCSGKFSRKEQLYGLSKDMQAAVSENLLEIYKEISP
jgi:hypothetical protein